ncbi:MAG: hypothetical protein INR66_00125 [Gordonia polyisoprenivorans]|nr:hypothetical protein [Gordonia polyisoprenivorans]
MAHWHSALHTQIATLTGQAATHGPHYRLAATQLSEVAAAARTRGEAVDRLDRLIQTTDNTDTAALLRGCRARLAGDRYAVARVANDDANAAWSAGHHPC